MYCSNSDTRNPDYANAALWRGTTILTIRKNGKVVIVGDGQVSAGNTIMKSSARKVRQLAGGKVITGFAGATADAFALLERLETKLEQYPTQLTRACVELAKDWRMDKYLRQLQAMMIVADKHETFILTGNGAFVLPRSLKNMVKHGMLRLTEISHHPRQNGPIQSE